MNLMLWVVTDIGLWLAGFMAVEPSVNAGRLRRSCLCQTASSRRRFPLIKQARECQKIRDENISNSEDK